MAKSKTEISNCLILETPQFTTSKSNRWVFTIGKPFCFWGCPELCQPKQLITYLPPIPNQDPEDKWRGTQVPIRSLIHMGLLRECPPATLGSGPCSKGCLHFTLNSHWTKNRSNPGSENCRIWDFLLLPGKCPFHWTRGRLSLEFTLPGPVNLAHLPIVWHSFSGNGRKHPQATKPITWSLKHSPGK